MTEIAKLNIVNENDEIIGEEYRDVIHSKGLLHREVHVWFYTPAGEIIFQHRGKHKDTYPDLLDATVGGHVELNATYEESALKEMKEETGIDVSINDLLFIKKVRMRGEDPVTGKINDTFKKVFAYLYTGSIENLALEGDEGLGFESYSVEHLMNLTDEEKKKFIPAIIQPEILEIFKTVANMPKSK